MTALLETAHMKIELTCDESKTFQMTVEVRALNFDSEKNAFSMPLCMGDDWFQKVNCALTVMPTRVHIEEHKGSFHFERYQDAVAFGAWLIEGDAKVEEGFRTMKG
jgi:hypothetical protein